MKKCIVSDLRSCGMNSAGVRLARSVAKLASRAVIQEATIDALAASIVDRQVGVAPAFVPFFIGNHRPR